jgi:FlaA1/EpsC-like NDP-sugar epimerase
MHSYLVNRVFKNVTSRWVIFLIELGLSTLSVLLTILFVYRVRFIDFTFNDILVILVANALIGGLCMLWNKTHHGLIRYSEVRDLYVVGKFAVSQSVIWLAVVALFGGSLGVGIRLQLAAVLIHSAVTTFLIVAFRLLVKEVYVRAIQGLKQKNNVLIYGAGDIGLATKKAIEFDKKSNCRVVGFIDDSPEKVGKVLNGKRILPGTKESLEAFLKRNRVSEIILSIDLTPAKKDMLSQLSFEWGVQLTVIPPLSQWIRGIFNRRQLKELTIESLLGRDKIELLNAQSRMELEGKVMLVTGAAGSIGSDICRQLCRYRLGKLVLLDQSETGLHEIRLELAKLDLDFEVKMELASIRDESRLRRIMERHRPHFVFHAAAYKHVPILEEYPSEVALTNVMGTRNLADAAIECGVEKFVMISTDKAVNPTNLMGACKRLGEIYVQSLSDRNRTQFITTRFGNVLGSNGSVVPLFKRQIAQGGPVTVTHPDITRYFMTIPEASSLVLEAAVMGKGGEIFVFDMGKPVKIVDLARKMIQLAGLRPDIDMKIEYSGLRPGEKMYEELFKHSENLLPTHHPKILKAQRSEVDSRFDVMMDGLVIAAQEFDDDMVRSLIRQMVPEFRQSISIDQSSVTLVSAANNGQQERQHA